jgi:glycosyltransferase involved in cell wall biosynthesis
VVRRALALEPDVIHVFKPKAVSGLAQMGLWYGRLGRRAKRPALVLDTDDWEGFGGWNEREAYPWWQKRLCDLQERWGLRHADAVTVASRTLQAQAWSHRVPPRRVVYVPNGLAPEDYSGWRDVDPVAARARLRLGQGPVLLLYTRFFEFEPERALDVLVRIRREVADVRLLLVGAGKYGQERRLLALARRCGLDDAMVNAGWQEPAALPGWLAAADVALFPMDDNLANRAKCPAKLLEALWLGLPVIADRVGQQAEYVLDGMTGLLADPDDAQSMAGAAARLVRDRPLALRLAESGRLRVEVEFNWPRLARAAEGAYAVALHPSQTSPPDPLSRGERGNSLRQDGGPRTPLSTRMGRGRG